MANFLDSLSYSDEQLAPDQRNSIGLDNRDAMGARLDNKMARIAQRKEDLFSNVSYQSLGGNKAATDGDNLSDYRLTASDGSSYDAWETKKDANFYEGNVFNRETQQYEFNPSVKAQRLEKLSKQRRQLDHLNGWDEGTASNEDVFAMGEKSKAALQGLMGQYGEDFDIGMQQLDSKDKSAGDRKIVRATLPDGRNIADVLNTPQLNASYHSQYNAGKTDEDRANTRAADEEANKDALFNTDSFLGSVGNTGAAFLGGVQTAVGKTLTAGARASNAIDNDVQTQEAQALDHSIRNKSHLDYTEEEKNYIAGKYITKQDDEREPSFLEKIAEVVPQVKGFNMLREGVKAVGRDDNFLNPSIDEYGQGKEFRRGERIAENQKFIDSVTDSASIASKKYVNNQDVRDYQRRADKNSGGSFSQAAKQIGEAIEKGDIVTGLKGASSAVKGIGKMAKNLYDNPGVAAQVTAQSIPEMIMLSKAASLSSALTINEISNNMDTEYKKTHDGKSPEGMEKLQQYAAASAIAIIQKGGTDIATAPMSRFWNKIKVDIDDVPVKLGKHQYHRFNPATLRNKNGSKDAPTSSILDDTYRTAAKSIDDMAETTIKKTVGDKTFSALKSTAKVTGVSVKEILKTSLGVGLSLSKNTAKLTGAGLAEYGEEFGEEILGQYGNNIGTDKLLDFKKAHVGGALGFGSGTAMRVPTLAPVAVKDAAKALIRYKAPDASGEGVEVTETVGDYIGKQMNTGDLAQDIENIVTGDHKKTVTDFGTEEDLKTYVTAIFDAKDRYQEKVAEILSNAPEEATDAEVRGMIDEATGGKGNDLVQVVRDLKDEILKEPTLEGKTSEEIRPIDIADDLFKGASSDQGVVAMLTGEKLDKLHEAIKNGRAGEEVKDILEKIDGLNISSTDDMLRVSDEITTADGKGKAPKRLSANAHMISIGKELASNNFKGATQRLATLSSFANTQSKKLKAFENFIADESKETMVWGKKTYNRKGANTVIGRMEQESKLLDVNVAIARFAIREKQYNEEQRSQLEAIQAKGKDSASSTINTEDSATGVVETSVPETGNQSGKNETDLSQNEDGKEKEGSTKKPTKPKKSALDSRVMAKLKGVLAPYSNSLVKRGTKEENVQRKLERASFVEHKVNTSAKAIAWAKQLSPDPETSVLLQSLERYNKANGIDIPIKFKKGKKGENIAEVSADGKTMTMFLGKKEDPDETFSYSTVIHELVHVSTVAKLMSNPTSAEAKELDRIIVLARKSPRAHHGKNGVLYGLRNHHEFLAELTNPNFRAFLSTVLDNDKSDKENSLLQAVKRLFKLAARNLTTLADINSNELDNTALNSALNAFDAVLDGQFSQTNPKLTNVQKKNKDKLENKEKLTAIEQQNLDAINDIKPWDDGYIPSDIDNSNDSRPWDGVDDNSSGSSNSKPWDGVDGNNNNTNDAEAEYASSKPWLNEQGEDTTVNPEDYTAPEGFVPTKIKSNAKSVLKGYLNNLNKFSTTVSNTMSSFIKVNKKEPTGVLGAIQDAFVDLDSVHNIIAHYELADKEALAIIELFHFKEALKAKIIKQDPGISKRHKENPEYYTKDILEENPLLEFSPDGSYASLPDNFFTAMAITAQRFIGEKLDSTIHNDANAIGRILGIPDNTVNRTQTDIVADKGAIRSIVALTLGENFLREVNISERKDAPRGRYVPKIGVGAGNMIMLALKDMNLVKFKGIDSGVFHQLKELNSERKTRPRNSGTGAYTVFVRATQSDTSDYMSSQTVLDEIKKYDTHARKAYDKVFSANNSTVVKPLTKPQKEDDIPTRLQNSYMKVSAVMRKALLFTGKAPFLVNTTRLNTFMALPEVVQKEMLGWRVEKDHLDHFSEEIAGKNRSIQKDIDGLRDFMADNEGKLDNPIYFAYRVWRNGRMGTISNQISMQQSKLHRQMFHAKDWVSTVNLGSAKELREFKQGFDLALGEGGFAEMLSIRGKSTKAKDKNVNKAIGWIIDGKTEYTKAEGRVMTKAIEAFSEGMMGFTMLNIMADYVNAKRTGKTSFKTSGYVETDGITNGSASSQVQTVVSNVNTNTVDSSFPTRILRAAGFIFKGDTHKSVADFFKTNPDNYKHLITSYFQILSETNEELEHKEFVGLRDLVLNEFVKDGVPTSEGRNFAKPFVMTFVYSKGAASMANDVLKELEESVYSYINDNKNDYAALKVLEDKLNDMPRATDNRKWDLVKRAKRGDLGKIDFEQDGYYLRDIMTVPADATISGPMVQALEQNYGEITGGRNVINSALRRAYFIGAKIYQYEMLQAEKKKFSDKNGYSKAPEDIIPLTEGEKRDLIDKLIVEGKLPTLKHVSSKSFADSLLVKEFDYVSVPKNKGGRTITNTKDATDIEVTTSLDGTTQNRPVKSASGLLYERAFSHNIGVKGFLNAILSFDANVQAGLMGNGRIGSIINVHDAQLWAVSAWKNGAKAANKQFMENHAKWSLPVETDNTLTRMLILQERYIAESGNRGMFHMSVADFKNFGTPETILNIRDLREANTEAKLHMFGKDGVSLMEQFKSMGNGFANTLAVQKANKKIILDNTKPLDDYFDQDNDEHGSSPDPLNLRKFNSIKARELNANTLYDTFNKLEFIDLKNNAPISKSHKETLRAYMGSTGKAVFNLVDKINYKQRTSGKRNAGHVKGNTIHLNVSAKQLRKYNAMSAQEALAHEVTHIVLDEGAKQDKSIARELADIFNEAIGNGNHHPEMFVTSPNPTEQEIIDSTNLYNYIFNNEDITEFGAFGLTNELLIDYLSNVRSSKIAKIEGENLTPFDRLQNLFSNLVDKLTREVSSYERLQNLANRATHVKQEAEGRASYAFNPFSEGMNKRAANLMADKLYEPMANWFKTHPQLYKAPLGKAVGVALSPARLGLSLTSLAFNMAASPELAQNVRDLGNEFHKGTTKFITSLANEAAHGATDRNRPFHNLLRMTKHYVEAAHIRIAHGTTNQVVERFHEDNAPDKAMWKSLTDVLLRTDAGSLMDKYSIQQMRDLMDNENMLKQEINKFERKVKASNPNGVMHINYTKNLGHFMATGISGMKDTKLNAFAIAMSMDKKNSYNQNLENDIDTLATLYSLKSTDIKDRKNVSDLFQKEEDINMENNGVLFLMEMNNVAKQQALNGNFNGDSALMIKGYVKEQYTNNFDFMHLTEDANSSASFKKYTLQPHLDAGYVVVDTQRSSSGETVHTLVNRNVYTQKYQSGIVNLTNQKAKGEFVFEQVPETPSKLNSGSFKLNYKKKYGIPNQDMAGDTARYMMSRRNREDYLSMETDASKVVGETLASVNTKAKSIEFNYDLVDLIKKDYDDHYTNGSLVDKKKFISISSPDSDYYEKYTMLPDAARDYVDEVFQGGVMVNEDYIDLIFGFRKKTLTNLVSDNKRNKQLKAITYHSEQIWQAIVSTAKLSVVVYTPTVLIANVVSNMVLSTVRGVPPTYVLSKQLEAIKAMHGYRKLITKRDTLERELETVYAKDKTNKKNVLARVNKAIELNPVHALVADGLYSTIAEDIDADKAPLRKAAKSALATIAPNSADNIAESLSDYADKLPNIVSDTYKNFVIAPDTNLAKDLREATQISDFVARYAMYKYRTEKQGVKHDAAIEEVTDVFINYDWNSSAEMQWMNDMGILMYTKFLFRIQKIIMQNFRDRPVNTISAEVIQRALIDVPDPTDSHLLGAIRTSRLGSPSDNIDQAFELNLLHYFSWLL